jgi:hypothetical protein
MFKFKSLFLLLVMLLSIKVAGQSDCQDDIEKAKKLFDDGIFKEADKLIKKTLESCSLSKSQENELLKLIASLNYEMDEIEKGDEYTEEFLKKNPYYIPSKKNDPLQFRDALQKLKSWPRFSVGIRGGVPLGFVETKKVFPVLDTASYGEPYTIKPSILAAMEFGWNITNYFAINIGAGLRIQKIQQQVPQYNQIYFNYEEISNTINVPLTLQLSIPTGGAFFPAVFVGGEFEYFANATYSYSYTGNSNITNDFSFYLNRKRNSVAIAKEQRNAYRYAALGGLKLMYKLKNFSIYADCRYIKELDLYNNSEKHYTDPDLYLQNNYLLGDIQLENLDISLGFLYHFSYKVKSKY